MSLVDTFAVQARLVSLMRAANVANAATTDSTRRVYDDVPQNVTTEAGPYVEIVDSLEQEDDSTTSDGVELIVTLNAWSEYKGMKENRQVAQRIRNALHHTTFYVDAMSVIVWFDSAQYLTSEDGVSRQAIIRLRCSCRS